MTATFPSVPGAALRPAAGVPGGELVLGQGALFLHRLPRKMPARGAEAARIRVPYFRQRIGETELRELLSFAGAPEENWSQTAMSSRKVAWMPLRERERERAVLYHDLTS